MDEYKAKDCQEVQIPEWLKKSRKSVPESTMICLRFFFVPRWNHIGRYLISFMKFSGDPVLR